MSRRLRPMAILQLSKRARAARFLRMGSEVCRLARMRRARMNRIFQESMDWSQSQNLIQKEQRGCVGSKKVIRGDSSLVTSLTGPRSTIAAADRKVESYAGRSGDDFGPGLVPPRMAFTTQRCPITRLGHIVCHVLACTAHGSD